MQQYAVVAKFSMDEYEMSHRMHGKSVCGQPKGNKSSNEREIFSLRSA